ncbi:hypothetical protein HK101_011958, partial [Irineochytrium annulatum]
DKDQSSLPPPPPPLPPTKQWEFHADVPFRRSPPQMPRTHLSSLLDEHPDVGKTSSFDKPTTATSRAVVRVVEKPDRACVGPPPVRSAGTRPWQLKNQQRHFTKARIASVRSRDGGVANRERATGPKQLANAKGRPLVAGVAQVRARVIITERAARLQAPVEERNRSSAFVMTQGGRRNYSGGRAMTGLRLVTAPSTLDDGDDGDDVKSLTHPVTGIHQQPILVQDSDSDDDVPLKARVRQKPTIVIDSDKDMPLKISAKAARTRGTCGIVCDSNSDNISQGIQVNIDRAQAGKVGGVLRDDVEGLGALPFSPTKTCESMLVCDEMEVVEQGRGLPPTQLCSYGDWEVEMTRLTQVHWRHDVATKQRATAFLPAFVGVTTRRFGGDIRCVRGDVLNNWGNIKDRVNVHHRPLSRRSRIRRQLQKAVIERCEHDEALFAAAKDGEEVGGDDEIHIFLSDIE